MAEPVSPPRAVSAPSADEPSPIALNLVERIALGVADATNNTVLGKRLQQEFLRRVSYVWVRTVLARRCLFEGLDEVIAMEPDRGVLFVSNHRSFFDQYAVFLGLYLSGTPWCERINFPVRSNFFYEHPLGMLLNWAIAANVMYPPVFRQRERAAENKKMVDSVVAMLQEPGSVVGVHPEGTRGKGPDPYEMLPAQPGIGQIALRARPIVIPTFIQGLSNDFVGDVRANFAREARRDHPVIIVIGKPIDYSHLLTQKPRPTLYKRTADLFRQQILELAPRERELRAQCEAGAIGDDDPRWLTNRPHNRFYARRRSR